MEKELSNVVVKTNNMGVIVKAGSIGGLEALLRMLEERASPSGRQTSGTSPRTTSLTPRS